MCGKKKKKIRKKNESIQRAPNRKFTNIVMETRWALAKFQTVI